MGIQILCQPSGRVSSELTSILLLCGSHHRTNSKIRSLVAISTRAPTLRAEAVDTVNYRQRPNPNSHSHLPSITRQYWRFLSKSAFGAVSPPLHRHLFTMIISPLRTAGNKGGGGCGWGPRSDGEGSAPRTLSLSPYFTWALLISQTSPL